MLLCWGEGHGSAIHDHADSHCFMKVLKGSLSEIKYTWPQNNGNDLITSLEPKCFSGEIGGVNCSDEDKINEDLEPQLQEIGRTTLKTNEVCYINGKNILDFNKNQKINVPHIHRHNWFTSSRKF